MLRTGYSEAHLGVVPSEKQVLAGLEPEDLAYVSLKEPP